MLKVIAIALTAAGLAALAPAPQASAQGVYVGPRGVEVDPGFRRERPRDDRDERIGRREATNIARDQGMRDVESVDRDGRVYVVRGEDRRGSRMRVEIDAYSGRVLEIRRRD